MSIKLTSRVIKYILMSKYRFKDQLMATSECVVPGGGYGDVVTYDLKSKRMMEIEIKISKGDLRNDLKKGKHAKYTKPNNKCGLQKFYYAVPTFMVEYCKDFLDKHNFPYGIIEIVEDKAVTIKANNFEDTSKFMKIVRRGKKISDNEPSKGQVYSFMKRISSELASRDQALLYKELQEYGSNKKDVRGELNKSTK